MCVVMTRGREYEIGAHALARTSDVRERWTTGAMMREQERESIYTTMIITRYVDERAARCSTRENQGYL